MCLRNSRNYFLPRSQSAYLSICKWARSPVPCAPIKNSCSSQFVCPPPSNSPSFNIFFLLFKCCRLFVWTQSSMSIIVVLPKTSSITLILWQLSLIITEKRPCQFRKFLFVSWVQTAFWLVLLSLLLIKQTLFMSKYWDTWHAEQRHTVAALGWTWAYQKFKEWVIQNTSLKQRQNVNLNYTQKLPFS